MNGESRKGEVSEKELKNGWESNRGKEEEGVREE